MNGKILYLFLGLFVLHCVPAVDVITAECVHVADGDTITILRNRKEIRVRLEGIDCPERGQDFANRARQFTSRLLAGKTVTVRPKEHDRYGRLVARILIGDTDVSLALVEEGLAWHYRRHSSDPALAEAEQRARESKKGLWSHRNPVPPWTWRQSRPR